MRQLPFTKNGKRYIHIVVNRFSTWPDAIEMPKKNATAWASIFLSSILSRVARPSSLHIDNGRQLMSTLFYQICQKCGITKTLSSAVHTGGNVLTERCVNTVKQQLTCISIARKNE
ncbi:hypothetical protein RF11_09413 [Thelohanellus kitauei]|uniref:Integrase catalytic domain-containing protein n=1 Tax=Thelohanellus kitauei TaxID=669202 RepID=A0A0C2J9P1_THEKT|nr:hypothetical protein RF11_09413 [Thelohanellus kitauei]